jgi:hypothetical protein
MIHHLGMVVSDFVRSASLYDACRTWIGQYMPRLLAIHLSGSDRKFPAIGKTDMNLLAVRFISHSLRPTGPQ